MTAVKTERPTSDHVREYLAMWRPLVPKKAVGKVVQLAEYRSKRLVRQLRVIAGGLALTGCIHSSHPPTTDFYDPEPWTQVYTPTPMRDFGTRMNSDLHIIHQGYHGF